MIKKIVQILAVLLVMVSIVFLLTACQSENKKEENVVKNKSEETTSQKDPEREKAIEAIKLVKEYYPIAEALYFLSDEYFDIDKSEDALKYPIHNYEEVIHQYLSERFAGNR